MAKVWVTGDAVVDLIPGDNGCLLKCPGGAPANVAVGVARLGGESAFIGRVGDDPFGRFIQQVLESESVCTRWLRYDKQQRTSTVVVDLDSVGERTFTFMVKPSADQFIQTADFPPFSRYQWLHVCSIALANEPSRSTTLQAMSAIKAAGGFVSFDPNIREEVWQDETQIRLVILGALALADVVKFSSEEIRYLTEQTTTDLALDWLAAHFDLPLVIVTQGEEGALVHFAGQQCLIAGTPVSPVDTTGAGDAFVGGLLFCLAQTPQWKQQHIIEHSVRVANRCGALATTQKGAMTALPTQSELRNNGESAWLDPA